MMPPGGSIGSVFGTSGAGGGGGGVGSGGGGGGPGRIAPIRNPGIGRALIPPMTVATAVRWSSACAGLGTSSITVATGVGTAPCGR